MIRIIRSLALALVLAAIALARPSAAAAQTITICNGQSVPAGYVVVAATNVQECPGYYSGSAYNSLTIRMPGESVTVCSALSSRPDGYAVVAATNIQECPGYYSGSAYNSITLRRPGETVTVCSAFTTSLEGYVVTARQAIQECPGYYSGSSNSATFRRVAQPVVQAPPPPEAAPPAAMALLDDYDRAAAIRLRDLEEWLGLTLRTHDVWRGSLYHQAYARVELPVRAGARYTVIAACDDDCADLDLRVMDGSYTVAQDVGMEPFAHVELAPSRDGTLRLEPVMANCGSSPCRLAVAVYETPEVENAPTSAPPRRERIQPPGTVRPAPQQRP